MVDILRAIPQSVESFRKDHPLRPPTRAEMLTVSLLTLDLAINGGLIINEKIFGYGSSWPYLDISFGTHLMGSIAYFADSLTNSPRPGRVPNIS